MATTVKKTTGKQPHRLTGPGPGRPKGVPNKMTTAAKDAIAQAAEMLGGTNRLVAWVQLDEKNESAFWTSIYPKLLPLQVSGEGGGAVKLELSAPWLESVVKSRVLAPDEN